MTHVVVHLLAGHKTQGDPVLESVPAAPAGEPSTFRLTASPGLVLGVAAEDVLRVAEDGSFEIIRRGGNLAVQVYARHPADDAYAPLDADIRRLGGYLDGGSGGDGVSVRVFTVPVAAGFPAVEAAFMAFVEQHPAASWDYGNVYDPADGITPLNWWHTGRAPSALRHIRDSAGQDHDGCSSRKAMDTIWPSLRRNRHVEQRRLAPLTSEGSRQARLAT